MPHCSMQQIASLVASQVSHEVLRRQGLLEGTWCLDPAETFGPGQVAEIDRVYAAYPWLNDDDFVRDRREKWLTP